MGAWLGAFGRWLLLVLAGLSCDAWAAAALVGSPPVVRVAPDIDIGLQNFALVQDSRGLIYVGNIGGVLEYDGEHWTLIPLDNREMVRSLAVSSDDRVYVGGYNAMGYLQSDDRGHMHYVDLTTRFAAFTGTREFADVWDTLATPEGIYFRALRDVFFWDPKTERALHWYYADRFGAVAHYRGQTLLQFRGEGFRTRQGDDWVALPGTDQLRDLVVDLVPLAQGGMLSMSVDGQWWRLLDGPARRVQMPESVPASSIFGHALALDDGSVALAAHEGSLYIVDPTLKAERHFKLESGYLAGIRRSVDGGFIVIGDAALYRVAWPSAWSMLGAEHGAGGSLERVARWRDQDYLISSAGVFAITPQFGALPTLSAPSWGALSSAHDLIGIDGGRALLADNYKLLLLEGEQTRELSPELVYPRQFFASALRPGRIYIATENGLRFVDSDGGALQLSAASEAAAEVTVEGLVERSATELWYGSARHGLWQILLDPQGAVRQQRRWQASDGLLQGVVARALVAQLSDGRLIASTNAGLFELRGEKFVRTDLDGLESLRRPEELLQLAQAPDGTLWAYSNRRLWSRSAQGNWQEAPLHELLRGELLAHRFDAQGRALFVASQSLLLHDGQQEPASAAPPQVLLRAVTQVSPDGRRLPLPLYPAQTQSLLAGDYAIEFQFALPDLASVHSHAYQARLLGYEESYSPWASTRGFAYSRLRPGSYTLQIRARDGAGRISEIKPFDLIILPPWYARWWASLLWLLLAATLSVWCVHRLIRRRVAKLDAQTMRLETLIAERTRDLATANARLEAMAHLDGLTGISNRRHLDHYLESIWHADATGSRALSLLAIDVDHFKRYNDTFGHLAGDQQLKDLVQLLLPCLRQPEDLLARYGGEEFIAVLPDTDLPSALGIAEAMRSAVEKAQIGSTISIGVSERRIGAGSIKELLDAADKALYAAKDRGRNRVVVATQAVGTP